MVEISDQSCAVLGSCANRSWPRRENFLTMCTKGNIFGYFMIVVVLVIVRDSSNFPIIIFPLLSSYFPTVTAAVHVHMHESIVLSRIDCMADWLVQVHTLNAFVVITKTLTTLYSSELHFWNS